LGKKWECIAADDRVTLKSESQSTDLLKTAKHTAMRKDAGQQQQQQNEKEKKENETIVLFQRTENHRLGGCFVSQ
jgi:hypothetical protein